MTIYLDGDVIDLIFTFLPPVVESGTTLSHRRNKGLLMDVQGRITIRKLNLEFFNSGVNDGVPSSVIREAVILRGRLGDHPQIVSLQNVLAPSLNEVRLTYMYAQRNLRQFVAQFECQVVPTDIIREVVHQLFRGLSFVHSRNIVHRNIRPENIFVDGTDVLTVRLGDWTQARSLPWACDSRCPLTPEETKNRPQTDKERARLRYKSPELLLRLRSYGFPIDIWSIGAVLLELFLFPTLLPWHQSCSESELLFSILQCTGTPALPDWPEGGLSWQLRCAPKFDAPNILSIARRNDFMLSEASMWERIKINHGPQALLLVARLLSVIPSKRPSSEDSLRNHFVLGSGDDRKKVEETITNWFSVVSAPPTISRPDVFPRNLRQVPGRLDWIGGWMFKLARLMDCQTSRPVHMAACMYERLNGDVPKHINPFALMVGCLKMSLRFLVSKDMFKQVACADIVAACGNSLCETDILSAERFLLNRIESLVDVFSDWTVIDRIELYTRETGPRTLTHLSQYIADLCLLDDSFSAIGMSINDYVAACTILAAQWLGLSDIKHIVQMDNVDSVQVALSACAAVLSEKRSIIAAYDGGTLLRIIEWHYPPGTVPQNLPGKWQTSRSYLESLSYEKQKKTSLTPPKPLLLRRSTIERVSQWEIESRRRKRSLSLTPVRSKRQCLSPFRRPLADENATPKAVNTSHRIWQHDKVKPGNDASAERVDTPRRSARLKNKNRLTIGIPQIGDQD